MITLAEAAKLFNISTRRLRVLCEQGRIPGATKHGTRLWLIPKNPRILPQQRRSAA